MGQANAVSDLERAEHSSSVLAKRVSTVNTVGTQVNPATEDRQDPTGAYSISDKDETGATKYYGYLNVDGGWYIMEVTDTTIRYAAGTTSFSTNWTNRAGLTYDTFNNVF